MTSVLPKQPNRPTECAASASSMRIAGHHLRHRFEARPAVDRLSRLLKSSEWAPLHSRQNRTVRATMRRYTGLSNGFGRKLENHMAAVAINYFAYTFIKIDGTLRVSPAMAAGVGTRVFDVMDL